MSGPGASALQARDRIWPAVLLSVAAHAALLVASLAAPRSAPIDLSQKPITAKLVRLGEARPKEYLPRKEEPPPPAAQAPEAAPAPAPSPAPAPKVVAVPAAKADPKPAPRAAAQPGPARAGAAGGSRLSSVLSQLRQELQTGSPDGDPLGDSAVGEGDPYQAKVSVLLKQNYRLPSTISDQERMRLTATVLLFIEPDGRLARLEWVDHSTNPLFDEALERAVRQTRLPPPPADRREAYRKSGLAVLFKI